MSEPVFLTDQQVETLHRMVLDQDGGQDEAGDASSLQSAVAHPQIFS